MAEVTNKKQDPQTSSAKSAASDIAIAEVHNVDERKVLRKIDSVILPLMCCVFFFQYLDKQSIGYAAVFNLQKDLNMSSDEYSWTISLFYFGQFVSECIFVYLMSRLPITRFVGVSIVLWGVIAACLAAPGNFAGFGAVRFLLGFCEGAVSPAFVIITSTWYKRSEHPIRIATWVSCNGLAQIVGAIMMYGIGLADHVALANWRIMFLVCGGGTVLAGIIFIIFMPLGPESAWFLTEPERKYAAQRLATDRLSKEQTNFKKSQMIEALKDPRSYIFCMFAFLGTLAGPVLKFASLVISGFGFSKFNTMLVGLPAGFLQILFIWIVVIGIRVTTIPRSYWGIGVCLIPLAGNIGINTLPSANKWGIVVCTWLATIISPVLVITLSLMASNIKGNTKKSTVSNMYFVSYAVAAIAAPQLWLTKESPRFSKGLIADMFSFAALITLFAAFRLFCAWENTKRDRAEATSNYTPVLPGDADVTDREDMAFRYTA